MLIYVERGAEDIQNMLKWMPLIYEFLVLAFRRDSIKKFIRSFYKRNMDLLENLIQQGIDAGEFQASSAQDAAISVGSIIEGTIMLWMYNPDGIDIKNHIISSMQFLLEGLRSSGGYQYSGPE